MNIKKNFQKRESKFWVTKREVKDWAWKDYNVYREVFKGSPSKREGILKKLNDYWPDALGSLDKAKLESLKKKVARDKFYGETLEKRKTANDLLKFLEALEKKHFP